MAELNEKDMMTAGVAVGLGLADPSSQWHWKEPEGMDFSSMSKEELAFINKIRKDRWTTCVASVLTMLKSKDDDIDEDLFKALLKHGIEMAEEKSKDE